MDNDNRISITICGDGGCGRRIVTPTIIYTCLTLPHQRRQILNNASARSQPMDTGVSGTVDENLLSSLTLIHNTCRYDPTIGTFTSSFMHIHSSPTHLRLTEDSYSVTRMIDGRPYFLSLTDTAGQEEYRGLWAASNLRSDAFLLVYDITQAGSLDALEYFLQMINMECDHRQDSGGIQPVKMVAGNKCDLKDARIITSKRGLEWARGRECGFMETSAREMVNIEETFARMSMQPLFEERECTNMSTSQSYRPPRDRSPAAARHAITEFSPARAETSGSLQPWPVDITITSITG